MNEIKISVIVPIYNTEIYLKRCLDSIINQNYNNLEIILVDDGSYDSSGKTIDDYASKDERIIAIHKENGGIGSAYKIAFQKVTGDYISFVDSDDYIDTGMYTELVKAAEIENADMIQFGLNTVNSEGSICRVEQVEDAIIEGNDNIMRAHFTGDAFPSLGIRIFKTYLFDDVECFQRSVGVDETLFIQVIVKCNKLVVTKKAFYFQYLREGSVSRIGISIKKLKDGMEVHRFICNFITKNKKEFEQYVYVKYLKYLYYALLEAVRDNNILNSKEFIEARNEFKLCHNKVKGRELLKSETVKYRAGLWLVRISPVLFVKLHGLKYPFRTTKKVRI